MISGHTEGKRTKRYHSRYGVGQIHSQGGGGGCEKLRERFELVRRMQRAQVHNAVIPPTPVGTGSGRSNEDRVSAVEYLLFEARSCGVWDLRETAMTHRRLTKHSEARLHAREVGGSMPLLTTDNKH